MTTPKQKPNLLAEVAKALLKGLATPTPGPRRVKPKNVQPSNGCGGCKR